MKPITDYAPALGMTSTTQLLRLYMMFLTTILEQIPLFTTGIEVILETSPSNMRSNNHGTLQP